MKKTVLAAVCMVVLSLGFYWVLIDDRLAPRTSQGGYFDIGTENQLDLSNLDEWNAGAKSKYGPNSATVIRTHAGSANWEVHLGDSVVETRPLQKLFRSVYGVFMVTEQGTIIGHFPFEVTTDPARPEETGAIADKIKRHLGTGATPALAIDNLAWWTADCYSPALPGFRVPFLGSMLRLRVSDACVVQSSSASSGTLLAGFAVVNGGAWIWPFARRICRTLSEAWVDAAVARQETNRPNYVACFLASDPDDRPRGKLSANFFEVRQDNVLAVFDSR